MTKQCFLSFLIQPLVILGCTHKNSPQRNPSEFKIELNLDSQTTRIPETLTKKPGLFKDATDNWKNLTPEQAAYFDTLNQELFQLSEQLKSLGGDENLKGVYNGILFFIEKENSETFREGPCKMEVETYSKETSAVITFDKIILSFKEKAYASISIETVLDPTKLGNMPEITFFIDGEFNSINPYTYKEYEIYFNLENRLYIKKINALNYLLDITFVSGVPKEARFIEPKNEDTKRNYDIVCIFDTLS